MSQAAQAITRSPTEVIRLAAISQAANGICFAGVGEIPIPIADLERMVSAVPRSIAAALERKAYYFVPLTVSQGEETLIADRYDIALSDQAVCHRNLTLGDAQCVFISTRLMDDRFSVAFEFYINVGHAFVDHAGVSQDFSEVAWKQALQNVRAATFADAIAIYMLSVYLDVDYYDLREREYPLLAPSALAERLRKISELLPANPGFEFSIAYRKRQ